MTKNTRSYQLKQLGTIKKQVFYFLFTPTSVTKRNRKLLGKDELALLQILILRSKYLDSVLPCLETKDAIAFLQFAEIELRSAIESFSKIEAAGFNVHEVVPGHIYVIFGPNNTVKRKVTFVRRSGGAITYKREWPGLQSQEVMRMLILRLKYISKFLGYELFEMTIYALRMALFNFERRAELRKLEGVNRGPYFHNEVARYKSWRTNPFLTGVIENMRTGPDGHIVTKPH